MIEFKNITLNYVKDYSTLFNANFKLFKNTLFIGDEIDGANSIVRLISKIDKVYDGQILIDDKDLKMIKDKDLNIAYVANQNYFFKCKSVFSNLYYPLKIRKIKKADAKNIIINQIKNFSFVFSNNLEIDKILNSKFNKFNLTQQKILCLIRSLAREPKILLLENFFENLDETTSKTIMSKITNLSFNPIIIAVEKDEKNMKIFENFQKYHVNSSKITEIL